tara:strand:- start:595 stop:1602 length:1008 start_codon:yes stop_codon:yes gene_type:complete
MNRNKALIIAEAGVNHNGSLSIAKKLIKLASEANADFVKFQIFKADELAKKNSPRAKYQIRNSGKKESQFDLLKRLELSNNQFLKIHKYCKFCKINFLASAFSIEGIRLLKKLKINYIKVPSGEITNLPLLEEIGCLNKKIFLSTGMSTIREIEAALKIIINSGTKKDNIYLMHCNTEYPTPLKDINLKAMLHLKKKFNIKVGFSDHSLGHESSISAVALGAKVIEKHITLDKRMEGPDHSASMEPHDFKKFVKSLRNVEKILGNEEKKVTKSEKKNIKIARRSIYAKTQIKKGDFFTRENLILLRPNVGISPMKIKSLYGLKSKRNYRKNQLIK